MFAGLGIFFSFAVLFSFATKYSIAELWILWLGTLVAVRYGLHAVFHRVSVHRGIWHSLLAGMFAAAATAVIFKHVLGRHEGVAWLAAGFLLVGYVVHLVLDELYSVDVMDTRVKASFGTAMKLVDRRYPVASLGMAAALGLALYFAPSTQTFVDGISSRSMWAGLQQRLLPDGRWFGLIGPQGLAKAPTDGPGSSAITTGSIGAEPAKPAEAPRAADQPQK
jgi:hypothetical protein